MKWFLVALVLCVPCFVFAQPAPPIDGKAFQSPGKIIVNYDEFTDQTRASVSVRLAEKDDAVLALLVTGFYAGKTPTSAAKVNVFFIFVAEKAECKDDSIFLLIDGERLEIKPVYHATHSPDKAKSIEVLMLPTDFTPAQLVELGAAKSFRGRIGGYLEFEIDATTRRLLTELAIALQKQK